MRSRYTAPLAWLACCLALGAGCARTMSQGQNAEGVRLYQQGAYQGAADRFQQAIVTDPNNPDGYYNLGAAYHRLGKVNDNPADLEQAETYYNQCLDHNANHRDCYRGLAVLLVERERSEEAFRLLDGWAQRSPAQADAKIELARLWEEFGDREAARQSLQESLQVDPYNSRALAALGRIYEESGDSEQALSNYNRSLMYDHLQPDVHARVASLNGARAPSPLITTPDGGTRTVVVPGGTIR